MKYFNKSIYVLLIAGVVMAGCNEEEFQELDINPQAVNEIDLNFLFTRAELELSDGESNRFLSWRTNLLFDAMAMQHSASMGTAVAGDKYFHEFENADAMFNFSYTTLRYMMEILKQTGPGGYDEGNKNNLRQATRIIRALLFQRVTDQYGNVPYFEAGQAAYDPPISFPKYDHQSAIYPDLLNQLDEASAALDVSGLDEGFSDADIIYGGDITKWKKLGYSLMLRMAMRVSDVDQGMANTYVAKAIAGGMMQSNEDNMVIPHDLGPTEWQSQNGLSRTVAPGDGGETTTLGKTLIDFLKGADPNTVSDDDPRLMIISGGIAAWPTPDEWVPYPGGLDPLNQKGMPNGYDAAGLEEFEGFPVVEEETYSRMNPLFFQDDESFLLMGVSELEFLLAEAAERGIGGATDAATHYNNGVKFDMQRYTLYDPSLVVSDAQVAAYLATYPYGSRNPLEMIGEQIWVHHFLNWYEAYNNWRRTEFPVLIPTNYPGNETSGTIPQRVRYPQGEKGSNPNFENGSTQPDTYTTRVWWAGGS
jgi:hypothetical protein